MIQAEALAQRLQSEIAAVDTTLRLFDPDQRPATIRPVVKRTKAARLRPGEFTRTLLGIIRGAAAPVTVRDLAAAVAAAHGLDVSSKKAMGTLVANTRAALSKARRELFGTRLGRCISIGKTANRLVEFFTGLLADDKQRLLLRLKPLGHKANHDAGCAPDY